MNRILTVAFLGVLIASLAGGSASAGEVKVSGSVRYKVEPTGQEDLGGGRLLVSQRLKGQLEADDKNSPLDKSLQECIGSFVIENGVAIQGHGYCVATDATHDVWWLTYSAGPRRANGPSSGASGNTPA